MFAQNPPVSPPVVVRPFDPPRTAYGSGHRGIDLAAETGQEVRAMAGGRVAFAGLVAGIPVVSVTHAGGLRSTYEPVTATVAIGDQVTAGERIGEVAAAGGHCGGEVGCLHVGLRDAHHYRDPTPLLASALLKTLRHRRGDEPAGR
jgi:murein DD-endopeptidase MepM/ murein hydrolase activator NlpD